MPTYQYRCTSCGNELEAVQKFTDPALTECPDCQGALRKIYNAVGVVFKGSGFYKTDSRSASKGSSSTKSNSADSTSTTASTPAASSSTSSSSSTSESKSPAPAPAS